MVIDIEEIGRNLEKDERRLEDLKKRLFLVEKAKSLKGEINELEKTLTEIIKEQKEKGRHLNKKQTETEEKLCKLEEELKKNNDELNTLLKKANDELSRLNPKFSKIIREGKEIKIPIPVYAVTSPAQIKIAIGEIKGIILRWKNILKYQEKDRTEKEEKKKGDKEKEEKEKAKAQEESREKIDEKIERFSALLLEQENKINVWINSEGGGLDFFKKIIDRLKNKNSKNDWVDSFWTSPPLLPVWWEKPFEERKENKNLPKKTLEELAEAAEKEEKEVRKNNEEFFEQYFGEKIEQKEEILKKTKPLFDDFFTSILEKRTDFVGLEKQQNKITFLNEIIELELPDFGKTEMGEQFAKLEFNFYNLGKEIDILFKESKDEINEGFLLFLEKSFGFNKSLFPNPSNLNNKENREFLFGDPNDTKLIRNIDGKTKKKRNLGFLGDLLMVLQKKKENNCIEERKDSLIRNGFGYKKSLYACQNNENTEQNDHKEAEENEERLQRLESSGFNLQKFLTFFSNHKNETEEQKAQKNDRYIIFVRKIEIARSYLRQLILFENQENKRHLIKSSGLKTEEERIKKKRELISEEYQEWQKKQNNHLPQTWITPLSRKDKVTKNNQELGRIHQPRSSSMAISSLGEKNNSFWEKQLENIKKNVLFIILLFILLLGTFIVVTILVVSKKLEKRRSLLPLRKK